MQSFWSAVLGTALQSFLQSETIKKQIAKFQSGGDRRTPKFHDRSQVVFALEGDRFLTFNEESLA